MTFHNLLGDPIGCIMLANLHFTIEQALVPVELRDKAIAALHDQLALLAPTSSGKELKDAFSRALHVEDPFYQIQSTDWPPDEDHRIAMVLDFRKVQSVLRTLKRWALQRQPSLKARFLTALVPDPQKDAVLEAIRLINELAPNSDMTIAQADRVLWGTRYEEIERVMVAMRADPTATLDHCAKRLRDMLGLVHIDFGASDVERFLILFYSVSTVADIRGRTNFACARPSTFDGFDNRRFCQPHLISWEPGWGMTIDIADADCGVGLPEIVLNPLGLRHFQCEYLGEVVHANFGGDDKYLDLLAPPPPIAKHMADALDARAAGIGRP